MKIREREERKQDFQTAGDEIKILFCREKYRIHNIGGNFPGSHKSVRRTDIKKK